MIDENNALLSIERCPLVHVIIRLGERRYNVLHVLYRDVTQKTLCCTVRLYSEDYDDEYLEPPDWEMSITEADEELLKAKKAVADAKKNAFGADKIELD